MLGGNGGLDPSVGCATCGLPTEVGHVHEVALRAQSDAVAAIAAMREAEDGLRNSLALAVHSLTSDNADLRARLGEQTAKLDLVLAAVRRLEARP